jgi:hypothetical protein
MMDAFRVWVHPSDYEFLVCVDGKDNARWLIDQLGRSFVFRSAQPIYEEASSALCSFQVPCNAQLPFSRFKKMLVAMPQVTLLRVAAAY